jgi:hypothetical protein
MLKRGLGVLATVLVVVVVVVIAVVLIYNSNTSVLLSPSFPADVNGDGIVNILDQSLVKDCLFRPVNGSCAGADLNSDGIINILDQSRVKNYLFTRLVSCSDNDGGINETGSGTLTEVWAAPNGTITFVNEDVCIGEFVSEWYCNDGYPDLVAVECESTCVNGACVSNRSLTVNFIQPFDGAVVSDIVTISASASTSFVSDIDLDLYVQGSLQSNGVLGGGCGAGPAGGSCSAHGVWKWNSTGFIGRNVSISARASAAEFQERKDINVMVKSVGNETCTDTDGGIDYLNNGTASDSSGNVTTDSCSLNGAYITEAYCGADSRVKTDADVSCFGVFGADYICQSGACVLNQTVSNQSSSKEMHLLRVKVNSALGRNTTDIEEWRDLSWNVVCDDKTIGDDCFMGSAQIRINDIVHVSGGEQKALVSGRSGTYLDKEFRELWTFERVAGGNNPDPEEYLVASYFGKADIPTNDTLSCSDFGYDEGTVGLCSDGTTYDLSSCKNVSRSCTDHDIYAGENQIFINSSASAGVSFTPGPGCPGEPSGPGVGGGGAGLDICLDLNTLRELVCNSDDTLGTLQVNCTNGCLNGACLGGSGSSGSGSSGSGSSGSGSSGSGSSGGGSSGSGSSGSGSSGGGSGGGGLTCEACDNPLLFGDCSQAECSSISSGCIYEPGPFVEDCRSP